MSLDARKSKRVESAWFWVVVAIIHTTTARQGSGTPVICHTAMKPLGVQTYVLLSKLREGEEIYRSRERRSARRRAWKDLWKGNARRSDLEHMEEKQFSFHAIFFYLIIFFFFFFLHPPQMELQACWWMAGATERLAL